jgi:hypothetical protein
MEDPSHPAFFEAKEGKGCEYASRCAFEADLGVLRMTLPYGQNGAPFLLEARGEGALVGSILEAEIAGKGRADFEAISAGATVTWFHDRSYAFIQEIVELNPPLLARPEASSAAKAHPPGYDVGNSAYLGHIVTMVLFLGHGLACARPRAACPSTR